MRGCAPALTVHIKFFHRPGLPGRWFVSVSQRSRKPNTKRKLAFRLC